MNDNISDYKRGSISAYEDTLLVLNGLIKKIPDIDRAYAECFIDLSQQIKEKIDLIKNPAF